MDCNLERQKKRSRSLAIELCVAFFLLVFSCVIAVYYFGETRENGETSASLERTLALPALTEAIKSQNWHWDIYPINKGDTLLSVLKQAEIPMQDLRDLLRIPMASRILTALKPQTILKIKLNENNRLIGLEYTFQPDSILVILKKEGKFIANISKEELESRVHYASATVTQSLYQAGHDAQLSDRLLYELVRNFAWDIDFAKDIHRGDHFSVLYNEYYAGGKKFKDGEILAATFTLRGKTVKIVRYTDPKGHSAYYTPDGQSLKTAFIRSPVKYSRISSRFNLARKHPILNTMRAHKGVDYAAPTGTPIRATGDGKIILRKFNGGYGNAIMIKHGVKYVTVYGHMSRFAKGLQLGSYVKQGQVIGYVGRTGLATGPHCHYEFRIFGRNVNPVSASLPRAEPITSAHRQDFLNKSRMVLAELALYESAEKASKIG